MEMNFLGQFANTHNARNTITGRLATYNMNTILIIIEMVEVRSDVGHKKNSKFANEKDHRRTARYKWRNETGTTCIS